MYTEILWLLTLIWGRGGNLPPPFGFPLITQKRCKLQPWHFAAFSKILLETFVPNLVFLTLPSLQILRKTHGAISDFRISGQSLIKRNCLNSWTSDDIDMKLGPVTKLDKKNKTASKKFDDGVMSENYDVIAIFPIYS